MIGDDLFFDLENTESNTYQLPIQASEGVSQPVLSHAICLANVDEEKLNTQEHFDSDSVFFVCDNASTGHICNDSSLFVGELQASSCQLITATSSSICIQEGTVKLRLTDDDGKIHIFILADCIYHPESPVNILSTRRLAESFPDADGNLDKTMRICSHYSLHTIIWDQEKFTKTFPTPVLGLPELLFIGGFSLYHSYCIQIKSFYNHSPGAVDSPSNLIEDDKSPLHQVDDGSANCLHFPLQGSVRFNDGNSDMDQAIYLGPVQEGNQVKHRIQCSKAQEYLVDKEHLQSDELPDMARMPISAEDFAAATKNLTAKDQIYQIAHPTTLDADQQELYALHSYSHGGKRTNTTKTSRPEGQTACLYVLHFWHGPQVRLAYQKETRLHSMTNR